MCFSALPWPSWRLIVIVPVILTRLPAQDSLASADKAAHDWLTLRAETVRLDTEWRTQREVLASLAVTLGERAKLAEEKRDLAKAKAGQEAQDLDDLRAKNRAASDDLKSCDARLQSLSQRLLALRPKLPPRLSDALDLSYRTLGSATAATTERMQVAMNVLNRCAEFDREVSVSKDILTLDGEPADTYFEVIYWGLNRGYAIDRASHKAWLGTPGPERWEWQAKPDAYAAVVKLMAIASDQVEPDWVAVPAAVAGSRATAGDRGQ